MKNHEVSNKRILKSHVKSDTTARVIHCMLGIEDSELYKEQGHLGGSGLEVGPTETLTQSERKT